MSPAPRALCMLALCGGLAFAGFAALGTWQIQRLHWKLALIDRVGQRVHAAPGAPPESARWPLLTAAADEYRHLRIQGRFLYPLTTRVQAITELGSGFWLLTPLCTADGSIVLVNRGFVAATASAPLPPAPAHLACDAGGPVSSVTGLLRLSEAGGAFLRHNDAGANRWYSRDVPAIAAARHLSRVAPYFIDADAGNDASAGPGRPAGGLTVISFQNNHVIYAITWYALALMVGAACLWVARGVLHPDAACDRENEDATRT